MEDFQTLIDKQAVDPGGGVSGCGGDVQQPIIAPLRAPAGGGQTAHRLFRLLHADDQMFLPLGLQFGQRALKKKPALVNDADVAGDLFDFG